MVRHYELVCQLCRKRFADDGCMLECDGEHEGAFLVSEYTARQFQVDSQVASLYRYQQWLPVQRVLAGAGKTIVYQSERLSAITGLPLLWIAFNGYWPERGGGLRTTTFKELEAYTVLSRLPEQGSGVLVVSSAGNTAAAFASVCSENGKPCLVILPESGLSSMELLSDLNPCVKIVSLVGPVDYYDAILLGKRIARQAGFLEEGGAKNIARREGLGTTLLSAVEAIGQMPDYYFQAIGSGAGGIAVHEVARRLLRDGRFGRRFPRLMLSQNIPFTPIYHSWKACQRHLIPLDRNEGKRQIQQLVAQVLSNQRPPYALKGGVYDVLEESQGDMLVATNREALEAREIFQEAEGIDIDPAAGVAFASLLQECRSGHLPPDALVLLNVTGGGRQRRRSEQPVRQVQPMLQIEAHRLDDAHAVGSILSLFG